MKSLNSKKIHHTWVSSDSKKILNYSRKNGASIIKRPKKFAKDDSELEKEKKNFDVIKLPNDLKIDKEYVPQYFEKDDESNWHIQYITAASNCRAVNYNIQIASFQEAKGIAGKK